MAPGRAGKGQPRGRAAERGAAASARLCMLAGTRGSVRLRGEFRVDLRFGGARRSYRRGAVTSRPPQGREEQLEVVGACWSPWGWGLPAGVGTRGA